MQYILSVLVVAIIGVSLIPFLRRFSEERFLMVDVAKGDALKIHKKPTSLLGGLAMMISMAAGFLFLAVPGMIWYMMAILIASLIIFSLGFFDDFAWKHVSTIRPILKFLLLLAATLVPAIILYFAGLRFTFFPTIILQITGAFFMIFLVVNSVNYQDGMDGLAGGLVFISLGGFLLLGLAGGGSLVVGICLVAMAAIGAFLVFNLPPAKIFMGDSGAYLLGFILALVAIIFSEQWRISSIVGPLLIIGLPVVDGIITNVRRLVRGKSIFLGDRSHFYDRLMQRGYSVKKTLIICYSLQIVLVLMGIIFYG